MCRKQGPLADVATVPGDHSSLGWDEGNDFVSCSSVGSMLYRNFSSSPSAAVSSWYQSSPARVLSAPIAVSSPEGPHLGPPPHPPAMLQEPI